MRSPVIPLALTCAVSLAAAPAAQEPESGFRALFDGESLTGWTTTGGRYDGHASWEVEDGVIVGRQGPGNQGGLLYTDEAYAAFDLRLETWIDYPFDSGVFLRMLPPETGLKGAQITLDYREGGEVGAIYADGFLEHNEAGKARFLRDAWNDVRVRCTGFDPRIECWLNGELLVDYQLPANTPGFAPSGLIGVQVHGARDDEGSARFRNVRIKPLPLFGDWFEARTGETDGGGLERPTEAARAAGWKPLFDEASLAGWAVTGEENRYSWSEGVLRFGATGGGGFIATEADLTDFRLRLDFQLARMANSGIFLRAARDGTNPAYSGCEIQLLDDFHWEETTGTTLKPWQFTGSLYGAVAPGELWAPETALRPIGEWNLFEILYRGSRLAVALNGVPLYDVDTDALEADPSFAARAKTGFLGLQHHGAHNIEDDAMVSFRNVYVQELER